MYDGLKQRKKDQHDYVDLQPRNVDSTADVAQSRGSGSLHTAQLHVKSIENIIKAGIPGPSRDESNKCSPYENEGK